MKIDEMRIKLREAEKRADQNAIDYWSIRIADAGHEKKEDIARAEREWNALRGPGEEPRDT